MIRDFIRTQPLLKILSLGMAFFLWFYVRAERKLEANVDVGVEIANMPDKLVVAREFESVLQLRIAGPASRIERIRREHNLIYQLDLSKAKRGSNTFWIQEEGLRLPSGVRVVQIVPQVVKVYLDRSEEKSLAINVKFAGALDYGFELVNFEVVPAAVRVKGTHADLAGVERINTMPLSLAGRRASFREELALEGADRFVNLDAAPIVFTANIRENKVAKKIANVPVVFSESGDAWEARPAEVTAVVEGPAGKVAAVEEPLEAIIDVRKLPSQKSVVLAQPRIKAPDGVQIRIFPERVTLVRKKEGVKR